MSNKYHDDSWFHDRSIRNFPKESREKPEILEAKSTLKYSKIGFLVEKLPKELTKQFILRNADYSLKSSSSQWRMWAWRSIVLLQVSGIWDPKYYAHYFSEFWDVFCERKQSWNKVYFVVDANEMPIQSEEFRNYVKMSWQHLIEHDDFCLYIVESKAMKRAIWGSIHRLLGIQNRVKMFKGLDRALEWVRVDIKTTTKRECRKT